MTREEMIALAKVTAARHDLPQELVRAVVEQESKGRELVAFRTRIGASGVWFVVRAGASNGSQVYSVEGAGAVI